MDWISMNIILQMILLYFLEAIEIFRHYRKFETRTENDILCRTEFWKNQAHWNVPSDLFRNISEQTLQKHTPDCKT